MMCASQTPNRPRRRRRQFSLLALIGIVAVAAVLSRWWLYEPAPRRRIDVHVDPKGVLVDSQRTSWSLLWGVLQDRGKALEEAGLVEGAIPIRVTVDDESTYGQFKRAVEWCWRPQLYELELKIAADTECFEIRRDGWIAETAPLPPPFVLHFESDEHGELVALMTYGRAGPTRAPLRKQALVRAGPQRGRHSLRYLISVYVQCDERLKFKHVKTALLAMTERQDAKALRVPIFRGILMELGPTDDVDDTTLTGSMRGPGNVPKPPPLPVVPPVKTPTIGELNIPTPSSDPE